MGFLDYASELCDSSHHGNHKKLQKRKQLQDAREKKRSLWKGMTRVTQVGEEPKQHKLTVVGYVNPDKVLHRTGKKAEFWPYVPYNVVPHPYAPRAYDKKAPPGYVRNVMEDPQASSLARATSFEVRTITAFSDENPNACVVM